MMRKIAPLLIAVALIASACNFPGPPDVYDWCWQYDFRVNNMLAISSGGWTVGAGYSPDEISGVLSLSYVSDFFIEYTRAVVEVTLVGSDIELYGAGKMFGTDFTFDAQVPFSGDYPFAIDADFGVSGNTLNVSMVADGNITAFFVRKLKLYGRGTSPFGGGNCDTEDTPTPGIIFPTDTPGTSTAAPTPTPSNTSLPTTTVSITPTPSNTHTPSITPTPIPGAEWCFVFNSTTTPSLSTWAVYGKGTWTGSYWQGVSSSQGGSTPNNSVGILYDFGSSTTIKSVQVFMFMSQNGATGGPLAYLSDETTSFVRFHDFSVTNGTISPSWTGTRTLTRLGMWANSARDTNLTVTNGADTRINAVRIYGSGPNPMGYDNCNPTPTPTRTPTATNTAINTATPALTPIVPGTRAPTATRVPIGTQVPRTPPPTITPLVFPTINSTYLTAPPTGTSVPGTDTPAPGTGTPMSTSTSTAFIGIIGTAIPGQGGSGGSTGIGLGDVAGLAGGVIGFGTNMAGQTTGLINQFGASMAGLIGAWNRAAPTAIPGAPRCSTAPMTSQLCAIWYILTHTIFAGFMGDMIITIASLTMDLTSLFVAIKMIRAIVGRISKLRQI